MKATTFPNYDMLKSLGIRIRKGEGYAFDEHTSQAFEEALMHFLPPEVMDVFERYRLALASHYGRGETLLGALRCLAEPFSDHPALLQSAVRTVQMEIEQENIPPEA